MGYYDTAVKKYGSCMSGSKGFPKLTMRAVPAGHGKPIRKIAAKERPTYERCALAFRLGTIWSWSIDGRRGTWIVKRAEADEWTETDQSGVDALLDQLDVPRTITRITRAVPTHKESKSMATTRKSRGPKAPDPKVVAAIVVDNDALDAYLARLVAPAKLAFANELVAAIAAGSELPTSEADWAAKVTAKVTRYMTPAKIAA